MKIVRSMQCANSLESRATGQAQSGLEQIVAVGKNLLALATRSEEKHASSHASPLRVGDGLPIVRPKVEGERNRKTTRGFS
jgi:hypothetical protein